MAANLDRAETSLTAVSDIAYIRGIDGSGNSVRISKADLANVLGVSGLSGDVTFIKQEVQGDIEDVIKHIIANYSLSAKVAIGRYESSTQGFYMLFIYSTADEQGGLPRYAAGFFYRYPKRFYKVSVEEFVLTTTEI